MTTCNCCEENVDDNNIWLGCCNPKCHAKICYECMHKYTTTNNILESCFYCDPLKYKIVIHDTNVNSTIFIDSDNDYEINSILECGIFEFCYYSFFIYCFSTFFFKLFVIFFSLIFYPVNHITFYYFTNLTSYLWNWIPGLLLLLSITYFLNNVCN